MIIRCNYDKLVAISELKKIFHPENSNGHPEEQIDRLSKILKYQGTRSPARISKRSGFITAGHGRILSAERAGWTEYPVTYQDYDDEAMEIADLTADNAVALWSSLDHQKIHESIKNLKDFDKDYLGIKDFVLPEILPPIEPGCDEDAVPDAVEPVTKLGDLYKLGNHRLLCGDSTSIDAVERLMGGAKADMVFTDPPYGVSYQSNMRTKSAKFDIIENDETFLSEWINVLPIVSKGWVFVWTTWKVLDKWLEITAPIGDLSNVIIWDKGGGGIGDLQKTFSTDYEMALVFHRGASITGKRLGSVWSVGKDKAKDYVHPTQKPVELSQLALENCTNPSNNVLDLFGGSGSTLIACEKTNRKSFIMELDPKYCDVIVARWEKYSGKKAELIDGS